MALRIAPTHVGALKGLAFLYFKVGDVTQAVAHLEAAQRAAPDDPGIVQAVAMVRGGRASAAASGLGIERAPEPASRGADPLEEAHVFAGLEGAQEGLLLLDASRRVLAGALVLVTRVLGVRGAMLVSAADGLIVADQLMEGIKGAAVAALAGSLASRLGRAMTAAGVGESVFWHLQGSAGALLVVPAASGILVVAV